MFGDVSWKTSVRFLMPVKYELLHSERRHPLILHFSVFVWQSIFGQYLLTHLLHLSSLALVSQSQIWSFIGCGGPQDAASITFLFTLISQDVIWSISGYASNLWSFVPFPRALWISSLSVFSGIFVQLQYVSIKRGTSYNKLLNPQTIHG